MTRSRRASASMSRAAKSCRYRVGKQLAWVSALAPVDYRCSQQRVDACPVRIPDRGLCLKLNDDTGNIESAITCCTIAHSPTILSLLCIASTFQHFLCLLHHIHLGVQAAPQHHNLIITKLTMVDELAPPRKSVELEDPGAKELGVYGRLHYKNIANNQYR